MMENNGNERKAMEYPPKTDDVLMVEFRTASRPLAWRKGMFYWNGKVPTFASYGAVVTDVIEWKEWIQ